MTGNSIEFRNCGCHRGTDHTRRQVLGGAAAIAASLALTTSWAQGQTAGAGQTAGRIDFHHHIDPPQSPMGAEWSAARAVEEMDKNGIATGIGFPGPIIQGGDRGVDWGRMVARSVNEFATQVGSDNPGRFGLFASLPMEDVEGALKEIEYAQDVLKADGFGIATNYGDVWLGDARFEPIYSELNRRKAVVFVHPTDAPCCAPDNLSYMTGKVTGPWIEWPMNTARTIFSLVASGTTRKYPDIRFIFCHGGGLMPLLVGRVDGLTGWEGWTSPGQEAITSLFPNGLESEYRKFYFECAQSYAPANMAAVMQLAPSSQLLFGSDFNRFPISHSVAQWESLSVPEDVRQAIDRGNAEELLPRWRS